MINGRSKNCDSHKRCDNFTYEKIATINDLRTEAHRFGRISEEKKMGQNLINTYDLTTLNGVEKLKTNYTGITSCSVATFGSCRYCRYRMVGYFINYEKGDKFFKKQLERDSDPLG